ncbi:hypothetical protein [Mesorhizobium sp. AR02]|nr:hypothetical protein [Mesorhizobium sp. AR02]
MADLPLLGDTLGFSRILIVMEGAIDDEIALRYETSLQGLDLVGK